jgi:ABC-type lipoprotein release transport system permease subunit
MIPKPGGGERALGIPTIRDRVAQTAVKLIIEPIFEADAVYAGAGVFTVAIAALACFLPARQAGKLPPAAALQAE